MNDKTESYRYFSREDLIDKIEVRDEEIKRLRAQLAAIEDIDRNGEE